MTHRLHLYRLFLCLMLLLFLSTGPVLADADLIFDWGVRNSAVTGVEPIPHCGHDYGADSTVYQSLWDSQNAAGGIIGLMLQNDTGPYDGTKDSNALSTVMNRLSTEGYTLDYVFSDVETSTTWENVQEMVSQVRNHSDPNISGARLAQYGYYPGRYDLSMQYTSQTDRYDKHRNYMESGLDVANPHCYPYEYFEVHTSSYVWDTFVAPNERSALFWAPLERFSTAKRNLPDGHQVIPFIAGFIAWSGYDAPEPTAADREFLLRHMRLRGADGYYTLISGITNLTNADYRDDMNDVWHDMDWFFNLGPNPKVLNLATNKTGGVEYSAMENGNRILVAVSNLSGSAASADFLCTIPGVPDQSPSIAAGSHTMLQYLVDRRQDESFEVYPTGLTLDKFAFRGPSPADFELATPAGTGNNSGQALTTVSSGYAEKMWFETGNPGFTENDRVVYSAWLYGTTGNGFAPVAIDDYVRENSENGQVMWNRQGVYTHFYHGKLRSRSRIGSGDSYESTNLTLNSTHWYEVQVVCDPTGASDVGMVYIRDITDGETSYTQVVFDNLATGTVESVTEVPLAFTSLSNPSTFNGWQVYLYGSSHQIDNLWATLYPTFDTSDGAAPLFAVRTPEPGTFMLVLGGLALVMQRKKRRAAH